MKKATRKDRRKKLTGGKAVDAECRNNGKCPACRMNRTIKTKRREDSITSASETES